MKGFLFDPERLHDFGWSWFREEMSRVCLGVYIWEICFYFFRSPGKVHGGIFVLSNWQAGFFCAKNMLDQGCLSFSGIKDFNFGWARRRYDEKEIASQ